MEFRMLKSFLVVAREENITRAANFLHITQPSLSRQMMQLEAELGVKLFHRSKHSIVLTEEGRLLKRRAQEITALTDKTEKELSQVSELVAGEIALGCGETQNIQALTRLMAEFQKQYPEVTFDIYTAVADDVKERMDAGILDLGLLLEPVEISSYHFLRMPYKERWCLLMRRDSPLAKKAEITPQDLAGQRLIITKRQSVKNELENWLGEVYDSIQVAATSNLSYYNRSLMVEAGLGVATCHEFANVGQGLCLRPLAPEIVNGSVLIWKKAQVFSPAVTKFIEFLKYAL
ncbi:MAG: LysR family transcriptional regulator [Eubacterium sp.]|nr:LysR family transcriptional regulator [Eubacterium sp.]